MDAALRRLFTQSRSKPRETITGLYLLILSRFPTEEELKIIGDYSQSSGGTGREAVIDLVWAMINSAEFLYRH